MKRFKELKNEALDSLKGRWANVMLLTWITPLLIGIIMYFLIFAIILSTPEAIYYSNYDSASDLLATLPASSVILYYIVELIGSFFLLVLTYNILYCVYKDMFANKIEKAKPIGDAVSIFKSGYLGKYIILILQYSLLLAAWTLLFIIPGIVKKYSYSQAFYIFKDKMDKGEDFRPIDCITESRKMMDGYKMNYFLLILSFIGWMILGIVTLGIAFLWIEPYMNMTTVAYYENLKEVHYGNKSESISINIEV
ncbi:putative membrane protein [Bacilli bacterium PM5-9]|nr:putative membrane protein [Bacilli bacterium PM5-9]